MFSKAAPLTADEDRMVSQKRGIECILLLAMKLVILAGLLFVVFGPNYAYVLLCLLYTREWSNGDATVALGCYCVYILALAVNGTSEFLHAVVTKGELLRSNLWLFIFSVVYMCLSVALIRAAPSIGLILAYSINMGMHIVYSLTFIQKFFKDSNIFAETGDSKLESAWGAGELCSDYPLFWSMGNGCREFYLHFSATRGSWCCLSRNLYCQYVCKYEKPFLQELANFRNTQTYVDKKVD